MNEKDLIIKCQNGNKKAYAYFVNEYKLRAYHIALGFVGSEDDAYDLSQEAFIKAYRNLKSFNNQKRFFTWFYQILRNSCLNFIRDHRNRSTNNDSILEHIVSDDKPDIQNEKMEMQAILWSAIEELSPNLKEIILLKDIEEYSYKEIAEFLDIPIGTVMSRLFTARKVLKNKIEEVYHD